MPSTSASKDSTARSSAPFWSLATTRIFSTPSCQPTSSSPEAIGLTSIGIRTDGLLVKARTNALSSRSVKDPLGNGPRLAEAPFDGAAACSVVVDDRHARAFDRAVLISLRRQGADRK